MHGPLSDITVLDLTIGEPDAPTPHTLIEVACQAMRQGRTLYSNGRGEPGLLQALSQRYSQRYHQDITKDHILAFPGTQTALYAALMAIAGPSDEVLVGDPLYATYEGVIAATGATPVFVPLRPERGFRLCAEDIQARITPHSKVILLNTPHNPTGAVLRREDLEAIGALAQQHDLWLLCDEVYEEMVFAGATFVSPLMLPGLAERVIVVSSISKSHAAPGFRSGWCVASPEFCRRLLPLSESILFGNQPFIADMTAEAVRAPSVLAQEMAARFSERASYLRQYLHQHTALQVSQPEAGMFALVDVATTGLDGQAFAQALLDQQAVAVMPGRSFGHTIPSWLRVALTVDDAVLHAACERMAEFANTMPMR